MHRNSIKTGLIITILLAALALPGWMLAQSLSAIPSDTRTISGESSILKARSAVSQYGPNKQDPSAALLADAPFKFEPEGTSVSTSAYTDNQTPTITTEGETFDHFSGDTSIAMSGRSANVKPAESATTAELTETTEMSNQTVAESAAQATRKPTSTAAPATIAPTTAAPTTKAPTTVAPTTKAPTTAAPTTKAPTTAVPTTKAPTTAAPTTSPTTAPASVVYWRSEILRLTNEERAKAGLPALKAASTGLSDAAAIRAKELSLSTSLSHTRPDGTDWYTALAQNGVSYRTAGENIALCTAGSLTPAGVMSLWMNSDGHRKNILNNGTTPFTTLGVGYYRANGRDYFVQLFIG